MIPKIIHYCWFGKKPLPKSAVKCIDSWKKYFPGYEIKEWNEENFDVNIIPYTSEAYNAKKYAFVSDYARFWILYHFGGIYFDTDVEVIKSFDDIVENGPFMGVEVVSDGKKHPLVNPGLGLGINKGASFYKGMLDYYGNIHFLDKQGNPNPITIVIHTTNLLINNGLKCCNTIQTIDDITIYPKDFFNPLDDNTGVLNLTDNTRSIHWYSKTWLSKEKQVRNKITRVLHRFFGVSFLSNLSKRWKL